MDYRLSFPDKDLTLSELVQEYSPDNIPLFIKVTVGYCGANAVDFTFSTEEIYLVTHVKTQTRVILKDRMGQMLSFPDNYDAKFHVLHDDVIPEGSEAKYLKDVTLKYCMSGKRIYLMPDSDKAIEFYSTPIQTHSMEIDRFELDTTYEERYLVGNIICGETMMSERTIIPIWMPIKVDVASGLKEGTPGEFKQLLKQVMTVSKDFDNSSAHGNKEVMLFQGDFSDFEGDYDTITPTDYYNFSKSGKCLELEKEYSSVNPTDPISPVTPRFKKPPPPLPDNNDEVEDDTNLYEGIDDVPSQAPSARRSKPSDIYEPVELPDIKEQSCEYSGTRQTNVVIPNISKISHEGRPLPNTPILNVTIEDQIHNLKPVQRTISTEKPQTANRQRSQEEKITDTEHQPTSQKKSPTVANNPSVSRQLSTPKAGQFTAQKYIEELVTRTANQSESPYGSYADLPLKVISMSVEDVTDSLKTLNMSHHVERFQEEAIDGELLMSLDEDMLTQEFNFTKYEARKMSKFKDGWRPIGRKDKK